MPLSYGTSTKTRRMGIVREDIDAGTSPGKLEICTAGYAAILATVTLEDPSGTEANGVLTFAGFPKTLAAAFTGTAALVRFRDSNDNSVVTGLSVGTIGSGADVIIDNVNLTAGNNITVNSASITHAP